MALSKARHAPKHSDSEFSFVVKNNSTVYAGAFVGMNSSGTIQPMVELTATATLKCVGISRETVVGDGSKKCVVEAGCFPAVNGTSGDALAAADVGATVYAIGDDTAAKVSTNRNALGKLVKLDDDGNPVIKVGPGVV